MTRGVVGILLAAGAARRYGAPKLSAARIADRSIGEWAASHLAAALSDSIAVVRPEDDALARSLSDRGLRIVRCPDAHSGMGASLRCGVRATSDASGWVVALADMPRVDPGIIASVAGAIRGGAIVAAPFVGAERGHPVGFAASLYPELAALEGDVGARELIKRHAARMTKIDTSDAGVLFDVDTPADLAGGKADSSD